MASDNVDSPLESSAYEAATEEFREYLGDSVQRSLTWDGRSVDWFLQSLIGLANGESKLEYGITLTVEGVVVTGILTSHERYFKEFAASFAGALPGGDPENLVRESFESYGRAKAGVDDLPVQYICLRNARYVVGHQQTPGRGGMLWRGKVNSVSGFSLGSLDPT